MTPSLLRTDAGSLLWLPAAASRPCTVFANSRTTGGLISYGTNLVDLYRRIASFVDKILKGAKPADLPVEQPTKFELVINLKTAKALGPHYSAHVARPRRRGDRVMMRRREFITLFCATTACSLAADAQTAKKIPRIGWLGAGIRAAQPHLFEAFLQELRELGYVEGQTIALELRFAEGRQERLPALAAELVRLEADVLVAHTSAGVQAAIDATRRIPIVMVTAGDPVKLGYVASLARPGGNVTGPSYMNTDTVAKRLQLLKELVPGLARVAVLKNSVNPIHTVFREEAELAARDLRVTLQFVQVGKPEDFEAAFAAVMQAKAGALLAFDDALTFTHRRQIVGVVAKTRLPAMYGLREFPDAGGLMSYGANLADHFRHTAKYVDKILKGAKPADLAVEQPTKHELVINLKTAKTLGLTVPATLLVRADEVIE